MEEKDKNVINVLKDENRSLKWEKFQYLKIPTIAFLGMIVFSNQNICECNQNIKAYIELLSKGCGLTTILSGLDYFVIKYNNDIKIKKNKAKIRVLKRS